MGVFKKNQDGNLRKGTGIKSSTFFGENNHFIYRTKKAINE